MSETESLEEITDIGEIINEDTSGEGDNTIIVDHNISYQERQDAFEKEWITFLKKEITKNFEPYFHLWFGTGANGIFISKMEKLANKHFRGILNKESLMRLQIFVKQLLYAVIALQAATKKTDLEMILIFVETFSKESFEAMDHWNWPLVNQNMHKLQPYLDKDLADNSESENSELSFLDALFTKVNNPSNDQSTDE